MAGVVREGLNNRCDKCSEVALYWHQYEKLCYEHWRELPASMRRLFERFTVAQ